MIEADDKEPRCYRYGWGVLDENLNFRADPGEKRVYSKASGFSNYMFLENPCQLCTGLT